MLAVKLLETGRLSSGQAPEMCGGSKQGLIDVPGHNAISVVQNPASELAAETAQGGFPPFSTARDFIGQERTGQLSLTSS